MNYANSHDGYRTPREWSTLSAPEFNPWRKNPESVSFGRCAMNIREGYCGGKSVEEIKEDYDSSYRTVAQWGNTPSVVSVRDNLVINSPCSPCERRRGRPRAYGCACNRLSSDLSDPFRTRYPIDLPSPFDVYELPNSSCPKCLQVMKYDLQ